MIADTNWKLRLMQTAARDPRRGRILRAMRGGTSSASYTAAVVIGVALSTFAQPAPARLVVTSPTLTAGQPIPREHTADGANTSPELAWSGAPAGTRSFAIVCEDPDVPMPMPFVHWVIYNIPASATGMPANISIDAAAPMPASIAGAVQGRSGFRRPIYRGPAPPPGGLHRYHFVVYALDTTDLPVGLSRAQLSEAMQGHVIGQGELVATYERVPLGQGDRHE